MKETNFDSEKPKEEKEEVKEERPLIHITTGELKKRLNKIREFLSESVDKGEIGFYRDKIKEMDKELSLRVYENEEKNISDNVK